MTNGNTSGLDTNTLEILSEPYFQWLEKAVLPNVVGSVLILTLLIGVIVNIIVIRVVKTNKHMIMSGRPVFIQFIVLDFVAYIFIIIPGIVTSFSKSWILSDAFCDFNGISVTICWLATFSFLTVICFERTVKLWKPDSHEAAFRKVKVGAVMVTLIWLVCLVVSILPVKGLGELKYFSYQHKCNVSNTNLLHRSLLFSFGMYIPAVVFGICSILIIIRKKQLVKSLSKLNNQIENINMKLTKHLTIEENESRRGKKKNEELHIEEVLSESNTVSRESVTTPSAVHTEVNIINVTSGNMDDESSAITPQTPAKTNANEMKNILSSCTTDDKTKLSKCKVAFHVYKSSTEELDVTLAFSYIIMFLVIFGMWLPYLVLTYINDVTEIWDGFFTLVVLLTDISYCIKPIVYLSHNRVLQRAAIESVPETLRNRASKVQDALRQAARKIDSLVFIHIPDTKSLIQLERDRVRVSPTS